MKVCILVGAFLPVPAIKGGAVEKMWHQLGRTFVEKGHDVVMVSREYAGLARSEVHDGILHARVTGYDMPRNAVFIKALDFLYTRRALAAVPDDSDVVVTNSFWAPLLASQRLRRRMYVDVARMPKGQMRLYRGVGRLRANSAAVREAIMRELPLSDHGLVTIVPNPLPFVPNVENGGKSVASLLYVGRVHPEKGVHILLQALRRMRNPVALKLVGPFKTEEGGGW